jgi:release factor glutamine methyltransferase
MKPIDLLKPDSTKTDIPVKDLLSELKSQIEPHSESAYLDTLVLLANVTGLTKAQILTQNHLELSPDQELTLEQSLEKIHAGLPLPYVLGYWDFFQNRFMVTPDVLIPRPESEGLVERALDWLASNPDKRTCLELGTGTGCIAISLAKSLPDLKITATDIQGKILEVARENARQHGVSHQLKFKLSDVLEGLNDRVDLLIANLPYIPTQKLTSLKVFRSEPRLALDGGPNGLLLIKKALEGAADVLLPGGLILIELDEDTGSDALDLAKMLFPNGYSTLEKDLSGLDRYLIARI